MWSVGTNMTKIFIKLSNYWPICEIILKNNIESNILYILLEIKPNFDERNIRGKYTIWILYWIVIDE